ncbi:MAG: hypothetical protein R6W93_12230 [Candidatus Limnocylindrales bacterium]
MSGHRGHFPDTWEVSVDADAGTVDARMATTVLSAFDETRPGVMACFVLAHRGHMGSAIVARTIHPFEDDAGATPRSAPAAGRSDPDPSDAIRRVDLVNVLQPLKPEERSQDRD